MESTSTSMPWYKSSAAIGIATILFPPLGLILLWTRGDMETGKKVFGSVAIVALSVSYIFIIFFSGLFGSGGMFFAKPDPRMEAHYEELERQPAQQREALANSSVSTSTPDQPTAGAASNANASQPAAVPGAAASRSTRTYWTDYRGPSRDGRYDEVPIRTEWPAGGPRLLWRQPIGGGYASFVVAGGVAFTIEQRRDQEAVTAYEAATGRELWAHPYEAHFEESMGGDGPRATPTWHEGRVYSLGALGDLRCLDAAQGKLI